ncbi:hypothetical protein GOBAR_DD17452 [Gossypium barbadense]|nr:hypothetical protein GOBAR_DD17452 [Gossypium barbadense]
MARNKEKLVLLLDVGPSMHGVLSEVEKLCSMLVEKKLIFSKYDELGVVVFGTEESKNDLTTEVGGYQNITVLQDIKVVDGDLVDTLQKLPRGRVDKLFLASSFQAEWDDALMGYIAFSITVWVYKKTQEEKFPTLKKYSEKAPASNKLATHQVKVSYEYKSVDGSSTSVIPPEQRIKGYRYGPQVVPISTAEWDAVKFKPEKGIKVLGFTDASKIKRHCYMKDVYLFIAEPGNTRATLAVSAIARAMKEMNAVAILRCVWRQGQQNVVVGPDSFYFNVLPFAEDVREYQFPSFNSFPASWQPNDQQQKAADELVQMLDLAPSGKEALLPEFTPNPVLERFYRHLELKAKQPDAAVPPLDETLKNIVEPDPELVAENKSVFDALHRHFELRQNPKLKKSSRQWYQEKQSGSNAHVSSGQAVNSIENQPPVKIEKIGDLTPVQDFEAMMSQRDNPEWVEKAIKELREKILALLIHSDEGDKYQKAVECVAALRKGCILEQEPGPYNDLMHHIRQYCEEKGIKSLPQLLASRDLTLISKSEAEDRFHVPAFFECLKLLSLLL